ncbi:ribosomal protein S16 [Sistotremastrum niveocremeum HHB9708]|uniref:Ribosomal protein S16 n=2 Tax=Sistotremastraceae TaxID=3402574 RepID=A0A164XPI8_9AGAM|nr:ribosomal protein S16 [Sistotremastrum niveocremeum HHB9708]KZT44491.1 ribosomal protein S16 [Sistotremastrum suecicum HHB10207 ss-3]
MTVRLRLAVHGKRNNRIFHLVAVDNRKRRDAKPIEKLGVYNPRVQENHEKVIEWNVRRIKDWLEMGAQPSQTFVRLMQKVSFW